MTIERLAKLMGGEPPKTRASVSGLTSDSRRVEPGDLFFCIAGLKEDGHAYAADAKDGGACALVVERPLSVDLPQILVSSSREAMNRVAAAFYGNPSGDLDIVGATGTNGKTTTLYMVEAAARAAGIDCGMVTTIERRVGGETETAVIGTPESAELQHLLRRMVTAGDEMAVVEATSIGAAEGRLSGMVFGALAFTNLTRDHFDYHGDAEAYYGAKRALFLQDRCRVAIINIDDPYGERLAREVTCPILTFGLHAQADLTGVVDYEPGSSHVRMKGLMSEEIHVKLPGEFNVYNALGAAAAAHVAGIAAASISSGIGSLAGIPGRFEPIDEGQEFEVIVDFAHTPDGLRNALTAARLMARDSVIAVFGAEGEKDRGKRALMGEVVGRLADRAFITSDNPKGEEPDSIIAEIEGGMRRTPPPRGYACMSDRRSAIEAAIAEAGPGDVLLIAGKGHETHLVGRETIPFDDRVVARDLLRKRRGVAS